MSSFARYRAAWRLERYAPALLLGVALLIYIAMALGLGQTRFLTPEAAVSILNQIGRASCRERVL